ncbi:hypothetical protein Tsubulata_046395 [Turnera subulata]|uniref:Uncharacterized protein n=1 Tax=Turnera subulata TaxID=218843 RepID=A0A9Q0J259_9ROSI|nr:hypothetical protein Tsubulata_046395 [Turnera subulata]
MVLKSPEHFSFSSSGSGSSSASPKRLSLGFLMSISSLLALCAKRASRVSTKLKSPKSSHNHHQRRRHYQEDSLGKSPGWLPPRSPLSKPKQLLTQISNKAITLVHPKKRVGREDDGVLMGPEDFGDGGVWQKSILMGDKCQPLDFSGVIYYDDHGNKLDELPIRSPRASPLPGYLTRGV